MTLPNGSTPPETEGAFIEWINSFPLTHKVKCFDELSDGQVLWQMLQEIDGDSFKGELPISKESDFYRQQNLQFIHNRLHGCLEERGLTCEDVTQDGNHGMGAEDSAPSVMKAGCGYPGRLDKKTNSARKIIRMILLIMLRSPKLPEFVTAIRRLPASTQQTVGTLMQEMLAIDAQSTLDGDEKQSNSSYGANGDGQEGPVAPASEYRLEILQLEEKYALVRSDLERERRSSEIREEELQAVSQDVSRLKETNNALSFQIIEKDNQLKKQRSINSDREQSFVRDLESKISQQEEVIGSKEAQLADLQSRFTVQQREIKNLAASNDERLKLRDEFDAVKRELEKQSRKANTAENYMKKLQASQGIEKERDSLRQELQDACRTAVATEKLRQENLALKKSNDETSRTLSQIEQEFEELRITNKQLRMTRDSALQQVDTLTERFAQDQETIAELKERQNEPTDLSSPKDHGGLEEELRASSKHEEQLYTSQILISCLKELTRDRRIRLVNLERQNQQLESDLADRDTKFVALEKRAANMEASSTDHYTQVQKLCQEILVLQTSLNQVQQGYPIEGSVHLHQNEEVSTHISQSTEVFKRMRDHVKAAEAEKTKLKDELHVLQAEFASLQSDRETSNQNHITLSDLNIDLLIGSLANTDQGSMLDGLGKQRAKDTSQQQVEINALKRQNRALQAKLDNQAEQNRIQEPTKSASNHTQQSLVDILQVTSAGQNVEKFSELSASKIDNGRERNAKQQEQIRQQDDVILSLQKQLEKAVNSSQGDVQSGIKPEDQSFTQNLERELKLVASAYHDLAGRLQMNNVVFQRRAEAPKSWLGRQRRAMESPTGFIR